MLSISSRPQCVKELVPGIQLTISQVTISLFRVMACCHQATQKTIAWKDDSAHWHISESTGLNDSNHSCYNPAIRINSQIDLQMAFHTLVVLCVYCVVFYVWVGCIADCLNTISIDPSHKSHNAPDRYPTMHHFVTEMYMCTFLLQNVA